MVRVESFRRKSPSKEECEDAYALNVEADVYGVLDGATPLVSFMDDEGHNGAYLAANLFKEHLEHMTKRDSLERCLATANDSLYHQMIARGVDIHKGYERWTTCVAAIKVEGSKLSFAQLGDCMILASYHDGTKRVLTKDTVKGISERAKNERAARRKEGMNVPVESVFSDRLETLRFNRSLANIDGGYTVADGMPEAINSIQSGSLSLNNVQEILILSDGLFHRDIPLTQVFDQIQSNGLHVYVEELTQELSRQGEHIDDRTAMRIYMNTP